MTEPSEEAVLACANCGTPLQFDVSYPVVAQKRNGGIEYHSFCNDDCQEEWASEQ